MTRLFVVRDGEREVWMAALVDEDVWTYVAGTGKFHRNDGARQDYFFDNELEFVEVGIGAAKRAITAGVGLIDDEDSVQRWRADPHGMAPEVVFASAVADLR